MSSLFGVLTLLTEQDITNGKISVKHNLVGFEPRLHGISRHRPRSDSPKFKHGPGALHLGLNKPLL